MYEIIVKQDGETIYAYTCLAIGPDNPEKIDKITNVKNVEQYIQR